MAYLPRFIAHGFRNLSKTPGRVMFVVSPAGNFERFFEELSALPADQPPDMVKVGEIFHRHAITIIAKPDAPHSPLV